MKNEIAFLFVLVIILFISVAKLRSKINEIIDEVNKLKSIISSHDGK